MHMLKFGESAMTPAIASEPVTTIRTLDEREMDAVAGGWYFQLGEFRAAGGSYGVHATWGAGDGHTDAAAGWGPTNGFYVEIR